MAREGALSPDVAAVDTQAGGVVEELDAVGGADLPVLEARRTGRSAVEVGTLAPQAPVRCRDHGEVFCVVLIVPPVRAVARAETQTAQRVDVGHVPPFHAEVRGGSPRTAGRCHRHDSEPSLEPDHPHELGDGDRPSHIQHIPDRVQIVGRREREALPGSERRREGPGRAGRARGAEGRHTDRAHHQHEAIVIPADHARVEHGPGLGGGGGGEERHRQGEKQNVQVLHEGTFFLRNSARPTQRVDENCVGPERATPLNYFRRDVQPGCFSYHKWPILSS